MSQAHRKLNWHPSRKTADDRYHRPSHTVKLGLVDMEAASPAAYDQGDEGSCTANACNGGFEIETRIINSGKDDGPFSRQATYYWSRALRGNQGQDSGSTISDTMQAILTHGLATEAAWPYSMPFTMEPSSAVAADAAKRIPAGKDVVRVAQTLQDLWSTLSEDHPVPFGFNVPASFMSAAVEKSGIWDGRQGREKYVGGHAVCLVGYDPAQRRFKVRNSWGVQWGIRGHVWIAEAFILSPDCDDFHAVVDVPPLAMASGS